MDTFFTDDPLEAADFVSSGKLVVFPTETVYGLGGNALDSKTVEHIYQAKKRPPSNPLIVHIGRLSDLPLLTSTVPPIAQVFMEAFFPGPLTLILPRHPSLPRIVSGGLDTVAVRMPSSPLAIQFLKAARIPVAAPSANLSGYPSATTWQSAAEDLQHRVQCVLRGPPATVGLESTVVDCTETRPALLRPGAISIEALKEVIPEFSETATSILRSPGMKHHHYAPKAQVRIVAKPDETIPGDYTGYVGLDTPPLEMHFKRCMIPAHVEEYSHNLFEFFRHCDRSGITTIYCQEVTESRLGHALMDRLLRAAISSK